MDTERNGRGDTARNLTVIIIPCDHDEAIWTSDLRNPDYRTFQGLVDGLIEFIDLPHGGSLVCITISTCYNKNRALHRRPGHPVRRGDLRECARTTTFNSISVTLTSSAKI